MSTRISLAQQIALLSQAAPADLDPEEIHPHSDSDSHANNAAAKEHYLQVGPSAIRQANAALSDPKYLGTRVSRADLDADSEQGDSEDNISADEAESSESDLSSQESEQNDDDGGEVEHRRHVVQHASTSVGAGEEDTQRSQGASTSDLASALRATREQDRRKGKAVVRQITLWDTLLDARIRLQKGAASLNDISSSQLETALSESSVSQSLHRMLGEAASLSEDITNLQEALLRIDGTPSLSPPPHKRAKISHNGERDYASELRSLSADASTFEAAYHPHLIQTLAKWSAKIQAVAPNVLLSATRSSFKNSMNGGKIDANPGVVEVIDALLTSDSEKLLARTRAHRGAATEYEALDDENPGNAVNPAVFDDTDFYQQLLRDVIESRGVDGDGGEQEWVRRQKARKARKKKTVDTRATKGRKLRYQVHEKLQNFMVPVPTSRGVWHDEQIDELFVSLLGGQAHE